jgi:penicillin-binding protein 2
VTPLQMAVAYAAIANGGYLVTPTVGLRVLGPSGQVIRDLTVSAPRSLGIGSSALAAVRSGLYEVTQGPLGLAHSVFQPVAAAGGPIVVGKTGTAQSGAANAADHGWFVGYAPYRDPKIVVAVVIEHGGYGASAAAPAVCQTIAAYAPTAFPPSHCGDAISGPSN